MKDEKMNRYVVGDDGKPIDFIQVQSKQFNI